MIISHLQLEECQQNPASWVQSKLNPGDSFIRGGYNYCLREAIYRFHKTGTVIAAQQQLQRLITSRKLTNPDRIEDVKQRLEAYIAWFHDA